MVVTPRTEQEVFGDLRNLCTTAGFAHVIAKLCARDNFVPFSDELTTADLVPLFTPERLIGTEMNTLIGLMLTGPIDLTIPHGIDELVKKADALLLELHSCLNEPMVAGIRDSIEAFANGDILSSGQVLREPIFYSGESAYNFQYRDMASAKYAEDEDWLRANKRFAMIEAVRVASAMAMLLTQQATSALLAERCLGIDPASVLPVFIFRLAQVAQAAELPNAVVSAVFDAFACGPKERNQSFQNLNDFNIATARPLIKVADDEVMLFQAYTFYESLYDSPFFWFLEDKVYRDIAFAHRGRYTEQFAANCFRRVFDSTRVFPNVTFPERPGKTAGEIDCLVLHGNRAIVLQAKSKRLTLEARRGNDGVLRDDFKKSILDSYRQGQDCAKLLLERTITPLDEAGKPIAIPKLKRVYLVCAVCDHYPALSFQARQFLQVSLSESVSAPFVLDLFVLDVFTEFLTNPLAFICYLDRRTQYDDKVAAGHELTIFSLHLKQNLWMSGEFDRMMLSDDISASLDVSMSARRDGTPGATTPKGILTEYVGTDFEAILKQVQSRTDSDAIEFGLFLLTMSGSSVSQFSQGLHNLCSSAQQDLKPHDFSMMAGVSGITVHASSLLIEDAIRSIRTHVRRRKYREQATQWFGLILNPNTRKIRYVVEERSEWVLDTQMEEQTKGMAKDIGLRFEGGRPQYRKVQRNEKCPCGGGRKYKNCHGKRD